MCIKEFILMTLQLKMLSMKELQWFDEAHIAIGQLGHFVASVVIQVCLLVEPQSTCECHGI